MDDFSLT